MSQRKPSHRLSDGHVGRESGAWAQDKLYYVGHYLEAFAQATKLRFPRRVFVDLLAGPGRCYLEENKSVEFDGSPLLTVKVKAPFEELLLVEGDPSLAAALSARTKSYNNARVLLSDCNATETITEVRRITEKSLGLVFADALGLSTVSLTTLRQLVQGRRFDLIYTFHHQDANRNLQGALRDVAERQRFESGLGPDWESAWQDHVYRMGSASTLSVGDALEGFFCEQLRVLGYEHVVPLPALMKNARGAPLYRLILASHHKLAVKLWNSISSIRPDGQRDLFR